MPGYRLRVQQLTIRRATTLHRKIIPRQADPAKPARRCSAAS
jgi:hypothetical protein